MRGPKRKNKFPIFVCWGFLFLGILFGGGFHFFEGVPFFNRFPCFLWFPVLLLWSPILLVVCLLFFLGFLYHFTVSFLLVVLYSCSCGFPILVFGFLYILVHVPYIYIYIYVIISFFEGSLYIYIYICWIPRFLLGLIIFKRGPCLFLLVPMVWDCVVQ